MVAVATISLALVAAFGGFSGSGRMTKTPPLQTVTPIEPADQSGPASLVDPFVGTGVGSVATNEVGMFPGADVPFGMVQWSPDTSPDRLQGGGYDYADSKISGFSLTHLSGAGCSVFGDVPILPTTGALPQHPGNELESFSHASESASPGRYGVSLGSPSTSVQLSVTPRTGIGQIVFPPTRSANLLFKVSDTADGINSSSVQIVGANEVTGSVTAGFSCGFAGTYTLHFIALFDRAFTSAGMWDYGHLHPGSATCSGTSGAACGAWVSFDTTRSRAVTMKVGVSYVSAANAASNLRAEDPGWSLSAIEERATASWNAVLSRIEIQGGSQAGQEEFYTALYHSLLDPSVFSDDNGQYEGFDGRVHDTHGRDQYANFSEWDIYRSEIPLLSMIDPSQVSDMTESLVNDASQSGWLPRWEITDYDAGTMNGDSADPIIADAYAFGVRGFDAPLALKDMLKGADEAPPGPDAVRGRQNLAQYEQLGYVQQQEPDLSSRGDTVGGSETLEYAIDDFSIAQLAQQLGDQSDYRTMMARAQNWQNLFDPATGYVQARTANGSFPAGPVFPSPSAFLMSEGQSQVGFEEGNAIQYTWSVPQDLGGLFAAMGGDPEATSELDAFFSQLTTGPFLPYDWPGNEPSLWTPWEYDYSGAPWRTQQEVRFIADDQYSLTPAGEPGNDDLGAMASWYVWAAMGLYPLTPGTANLVMSSPMFPTVTIHLADGKILMLTAEGTPAVYVSSADVSIGSGTPAPWNQPWLPASILQTGGVVGFTLGTEANPTWGSSPGSAPPSYDQFAAPAIGFTIPSGAVVTQTDKPATVTVGLQSDQDAGMTFTWSAKSSGVTIVPSSGQLVLPALPATGPFPRTSVTVELTAMSSGTRDVQFTFSVAGQSARVPSLTLEVDVDN